MSQARRYEIPTSEAPTETGRRPRVLLAEDDDDVRHLIVSTLEEEGYEVYGARSGNAALFAFDWLSKSAFPGEGIDLVLVDHEMSGGSGLEVLWQMQRAPHPTPAILMVTFTNAEVIAEAERMGVPVLTKPFSLRQLDARIQAELLTSRHAERSGSFQIPSELRQGA